MATPEPISRYMAAIVDARRPALDGAIPLAALLTLLLAVPGLEAFIPALAAVVLVFAAAMSLSTGADRPGEPALAWRLYGVGAAALAVTVIIGGPVETMPLGMIVLGLLVHVHAKARHGVGRVGLLSAFGRRAHDGRVGRTLEAACLVLTVAAVTHEPALYVVGGWLLTSAAVAERPTGWPTGHGSEQDGPSAGPPDFTPEPEGRPSSVAPAPAA